jgi:rod shape-determining protein MreC
VSSDLPLKANKERAAFVIIPLLLLHLVLLSLQIERPSGTRLIKTWIMAVQAPIITASSAITRSIQHVWRGYVWMTGARSENEQLQQTVRRLSQLNSTYEQARQENIRLCRLLAIKENAGYRSIGARVVARSPSFLANILYIDRGSEDDVRVDAPVLSGDGIIGRTVLVSKHQSQVQLITNGDASLGAMLEKSRSPGVLMGTGNPLLDLNYISNTEPVAIGDLVLSSGLDGIFPKGFAIGKVVQLQKGKDVFHSIKVEPGIDFIHLEEVMVLLGDSITQSESAPK